MAGDSKEAGDLGGAWSHTATQPLDSVYGAGELDIENSHDILGGGEFNASTSNLAADTGWDLGTSSSTTTRYYYFDLVADAASFTASLNWNAVVTATDTTAGFGITYDFSTTLPNLDLRLYTATGYATGTLLESSVGTIDNVELIYGTHLTAGRYALAVTSDTTGIEYGLAWTTTSAIPEPSASAALAGLATLTLATIRRRHRALLPPRPRRQFHRPPQIRTHHPKNGDR